MWCICTVEVGYDYGEFDSGSTKGVAYVAVEIKFNE